MLLPHDVRRRVSAGRAHDRISEELSQHGALMPLPNADTTLGGFLMLTATFVLLTKCVIGAILALTITTTLESRLCA